VWLKRLTRKFTLCVSAAGLTVLLVGNKYI